MRRALIWAVALASTIGFGYLAIRDAHPDEVWDALQEANIWWVVPSFAVLAVAVAVRALRWQLLFQRETRPPYGATAAATIVGLAVNSLLPLRAGEAARVIALNRRAGTSPVESAATVALERILDVFCLLLLLLAALPWLPEVDWVGAAAAIALALALMLGGCGAAVRGLRRPAVPRARPAAPAVAVRAPRVGRARRGEPAPRARRAAGPEARADGLRPHHRGLAPDERVVLAR